MSNGQLLCTALAHTITVVSTMTTQVLSIRSPCDSQRQSSNDVRQFARLHAGIVAWLYVRRRARRRAALAGEKPLKPAKMKPGAGRSPSPAVGKGGGNGGSGASALAAGQGLAPPSEGAGLGAASPAADAHIAVDPAAVEALLDALRTDAAAAVARAHALQPSPLLTGALLAQRRAQKM